MSTKLRVLYITRKYPPRVGGMEKMNAKLAENLRPLTKLDLIAKSTKNWQLPGFMAIAFVGGYRTIRKNKINHIHVGDGVLAPLGYLLSRLTGVTVTATIHGLDITHEGTLYKILIKPFIKKMHKVVCVSTATAAACQAQGIAASKTTVIGLGVDEGEFELAPNEVTLPKDVSGFMHNKTVLLTTGRLVKRKGVAWFIEKVLPQLPANYVYVVSGGGEEKVNIDQVISKRQLQQRVLMLGQTSPLLLKQLYAAADIFIMPNIPVKNNIEGFGIVALEAASAGLPIVASRLGGIVDAVTPEIGKLFEAENAGAAIKAIAAAQAMNSVAIIAATKQRSWDRVAHQYLAVFQQVTKAPE